MLDGIAYDSASETPPYVDLTKMSARAVISDATSDRVGDVLLPIGIQLDDYRRNPVVFWDHGLQDGFQLPIGRCEDDNGNLTIQITDDEVIATTYFSQSNANAIQIFDLIVEKIIRATSVRETALKAKQLFRGGKQINFVSEWTLEELSWTGLPVNPSAIAKSRIEKYLTKNRVDGKQIHPSIMKSLNAICPKPKKTGIGSEFKMADGKDKKDEDAPDDSQNGKGTTGSAEASEVEAGGGEPNDTTDAGNPSPVDCAPEDMPYGKQVADATHSGLKSVAGMLTSSLTPKLEHEGVKSDLGDVNDQVKSLMTQVQGIHAKHYPQFKCDMKSDDEGEEGEEGDDEDSDSAMKSFLARHNPSNLEVTGTAARLKSMSKETNLTPSQRKILATIATQLDGLCSKAKSYRPEPKVEPKAPKVEDDPEKVKALESAIKSLNQTLSQLKGGPGSGPRSGGGSSSPNERSEHYHTGYEASSQGEPRSANPHPSGTFNHKEWNSGHSDHSNGK